MKLFPAGAARRRRLARAESAGRHRPRRRVSLSNFSPYAPAVDLINIPYWCGENQRYANLVTSKAWADEITPKVNAKDYKPLFYYTVDPRTIAVRKGFGRIVQHARRHERRRRCSYRRPSCWAVLPARRRQPDHRRVGRDADGAEAGCGGCARSVGRRALYLRLHRHPRSDHDGRVGTGRADVRVQPAVVQRPAENVQRNIRGGRGIDPGASRSPRSSRRATCRCRSSPRSAASSTRPPPTRKNAGSTRAASKGRNGTTSRKTSRARLDTFEKLKKAANTKGKLTGGKLTPVDDAGSPTRA